MQFLWNCEVPVGYLFTTQLDAGAVARGLERALGLYPLLAGRLGKHVDADRVQRLHIDVAHSQGALWEVVHDGASPLPEPAAARGARGGRAGAAPPHGPGAGSRWDRFFPKPVRLLPVLWEPPWRRPLLRARLTQLTAAGASVLTLCVAHVAMDGRSVSDFVGAWSHCAGLEAVAARGAEALVLPAALPCAAPSTDRAPGGPDFERLVEDARRQQHEARRRGGRGAAPLAAWRMGVRGLAAWLPRLYVAHFTDARADFGLAVDDVASLKAAASAGLADGEWVSSFEVVAAALCAALADVDAAPRRGEGGAPAHPYHVRVLANSRGRERLSPAGYVGNAVHFARAHISPDAQLQPEPACGGTAPRVRAWLARAARDVRRTLRASLADGAAMERAHAAFELGVRDGRANAGPISRLCWCKAWAQNFASSDGGGAPVVINSWLAFPWLDVTFGASERPALMRVPTSFSYRRLVFIAPRSRGELCVRVQLPAAQLRRFEAAVKALGLPLRRLDHR